MSNAYFVGTDPDVSIPTQCVGLVPPIEYGGALWLADCHNRSSGPPQIGVYRSTDRIHFANQDQVNSPTFDQDFVLATTFYPNSGGQYIYFIYGRETSDPLEQGIFRTIIFDMAANGGLGGYLAPSAEASFPYLWSERLGLAVRSDGTQVAFFTGTTGTHTPSFRLRLCYSVLAAGVWGAPVSIAISDVDPSTNPVTLQAVGLDASDNIAIVYGEFAISPLTQNCWIKVLDSSFSLSTRLLISASGVASFTPVFVQGTEWWVTMTINSAPLTNPRNYSVARISPLVAPAAVTLDAAVTGVNPFNPPPTQFFPVLALGATDQYFAYSTKLASGNYSINYKTQPISGGAWSAEQTLFDGDSDSLIPDYTNEPTIQIQDLSFGILPSDGFTAAQVGVKFTGHPTVFCVNMAYFVAPPSPTLALACPVDGGTAQAGVPYNSGAPVVTGNPTLPLTFSIASGALPSGFSLDPATGAVSGTTFQSGPFGYTLEVTDSSSPPLHADVSEPCQINVGTISGPCEVVIPQPSTDVQFKLQKVIATLKPVTHLPVRGSVK